MFSVFSVPPWFFQQTQFRVSKERPMFHGLRWRIAVSYASLIAFILLSLAVWLPGRVRAARLADLRARLTAEARLVAADVAPHLDAAADPETLNAFARHTSALVDAQVAFLGPDGAVLGASDVEAAAAGSRYRPEVQQALTAGVGHSIRANPPTGAPTLYLAVPVRVDEQVRGFVEVAASLVPIDADTARLRRVLLGVALLALLATGVLAILIAEGALRPLRQMRQVMQRMAQGDLDARLLPTTSDEVGDLLRAFNRLADRLRDELGSLRAERNRLGVVLDHLADGVLITDAAGRVKWINPAAVRLLGTTEAAALERSFAQVVRHHRLIELWKLSRQRNDVQADTVELEHRQRFIQATITPLHEDQFRGYLVLLRDLTQMRRLETVRRDFVSNISHELRTPLASLKALVDTLRDGALEDPPAARRFLDRIETEVDAMTQMVQELLELSRIESGQVPLRLHPTPVAEVVSPPVERLRPQAERAGLRLRVDLPPGLPAVLADAERVQQVVTNLVHNAIKFTPQGGEVVVAARLVGDEVVISVRDTGIGIPAQDLPRIFERFYKADRARSGGGTGLGLAIAKHVVQAHGGRIWAESVEGQGSTFYFSLPVGSS